MALYWYSKKQAIPSQTFTDVVYADDIALQANTLDQAESLLRRLEKVAGAIGFHVNTDKTEYMSFNKNKTREISTQTGSSLKLVQKCIYLGNSVSSTVNGINTRLTKSWSAIDWLSVLGKSNLSDNTPAHTHIHTHTHTHTHTHIYIYFRK